MLAQELAVSRATVREALRSLAARNLIRTAKGAGGGSYVTSPSVDGVSDFLQSSITLMAQADDVGLEQLIEARELLEVPAARLAAVRRREELLVRLRAAIPEKPLRLGTQQQFLHNRDFHWLVLEGCANPLLAIAAQPLFTTLQTNLARSSLGARFHRSVNDHHRAIMEAIAEGDADAAGEEMLAHLEFLRPFYEKAWRSRSRHT
jgi:GntR family transcriptional repressor for pyruvate dehydrogenase complex